MNPLSPIQAFWIQRVHPFFVVTRFVFTIANALTSTIGTIYLLGKGLSFTEVGLVWSVTLFFSTVLDFPTGNFADLYGRKLAYVLGVISIGIGNFIFGVGETITVFFVAAFFVGLGAAQISGSLSSWVVDEQIKVNKKDEIRKIFGDGSSAASVGGIVGGLLVGLLFDGPLEIIYFASAFIFIGLGIFVFMNIPDNYGKPGGRWISLPREVITHFVHSLPLIIASAALVLTFACYTVFLFLWQPLALEYGIVEGDLGYLYSIFMAGSAAGAFIMGRIGKRIHEVMILLICFAVTGTGFVTISLNLGILGLVAGLLQFALGYGGFIPVLYAWVNQFIPSSIRASATSLIATIGTGGIIVLQVLMGAFVQSWGLIAASLCAVAFALLGAFLLLFLYRRS
ncbi:MAG: MFS transporter [Theionarchaea archaeon]|nr:MFS transporter [Theionarchaea archaeon]